MSHGRRMLEAQAQKERTSGTREDGRLDDGHLRNGQRALNDDGTPVRPTRGDAVLVSPPPRPSTSLGLSHVGSSGASNGRGSSSSGGGRPRLSGVGPSPAVASTGSAASTPLALARRRPPLPEAGRAAECVDVDVDDGTAGEPGEVSRRRAIDGRSASQSRDSGGPATAEPRSYPASRMNVSSAAAAVPVVVVASGPTGRSRTRSHSPSVLSTRRAAPPPTPVTAALLRLGGTATTAEQTAAHRPPPLHSTSSLRCATGAGGVMGAATPPLSMPMSPASPPLRAGVSPRMLPLHPTRADGRHTSLSITRAGSASTTTAASTFAPSPLSSQVQLPVSPYELQQPQPPSMPPTPPSLPCATSRQGAAPPPLQPGEEDARHHPVSLPGETAAAPEWRSPPPSPLPACATSPAHPRLPPLPGPAALRDDVAATPLTRGFDPHRYPFVGDFSGFHNTGNDCYGCSLLTMLLRNSVFRRALLGSPLVCALRMYEALATGRPERRVQWTNGYIDADAAASAKARRTAAQKRSRAADSPDEADGGGGGDGVVEPAVTDAAVSGPSPYVFHPSAAVRQTLRALATFSLDELEEVLDMDAETERLPATLHGALAVLVRAQRWREHLTGLVNARCTRAAERHRLLEAKVYHDNDRDFDGQLYTSGLRLTAVAALFDSEFFIGDQEDAHELFVAVMARLETEAVSFQERCNDVLRRRCTLDVAFSAGGSTVASSSQADGAETALPLLSVSTAAAEAWVNVLAQVRLLNIIRCRAADCRHEIVTEEVCVNLSLHIAEASSPPPPPPPLQPPPPPPPPPSTRSRSPAHSYASTTAPCTCSPSPLSSPSVSRSSCAAAAPADCQPARDVDGCGPSVADRLHTSMAYEALADYRCDGCGARVAQFQGGCLYTRPPPLLVLQLKRFATSFAGGVVVIRKNGSPVAVEDTLVLHALPSAAELREWRSTLRQREEAHPAETAEGSRGGTDDSYYDAERKCFSAALRSAGEDDNDGGGGGGGGAAPPARVWAIRCVYRLRSCVLHLGQSLHYGHYVADFAADSEDVDTCDDSSDTEADADEGDRQHLRAGAAPAPPPPPPQRRRRRWRRANDERVEVLRGAAVRTRRTGRSDTYLLLYEKVVDEWVRCAAEAVLPSHEYHNLADPGDGGR